MRILAFNGSPRKQGNGAALISAVIDDARKNGHTAKVVNLYGKKIPGCRACDRRACDDWKTADTACNYEGRHGRRHREILTADARIISSPVYMGQVSGPMKTFLDRWCVFFGRDFNIRFLPGKKLVTIITSGAPATSYQGVADSLDKLLGGFFQLDLVGRLSASNLSRKRDVLKQKGVMNKAVRIGRSV